MCHCVRVTFNICPAKKQRFWENPSSVQISHSKILVRQNDNDSVLIYLLTSSVWFFWVRWGVGVSVCPPVTQIWNTGRNLQQMTLKSIKYLSFLESIYLTHFCHFFELVLFNVGFHFLFCFWSLMFKVRSTYRSSCFGFSATWFFCSFCCCS